MLILDRLDDMEKPQMLAKVFAAFIRSKIDYGTFRHLASAIDHGTAEDLAEFAKPEPSPTTPQPRRDPKKRILYTNLAGTALVGLPFTTGTAPMSGVAYEISNLGKTFQACMAETA